MIKPTHVEDADTSSEHVLSLITCSDIQSLLPRSSKEKHWQSLNDRKKSHTFRPSLWILCNTHTQFECPLLMESIFPAEKIFRFACQCIPCCT